MSHPNRQTGGRRAHSAPLGAEGGGRTTGMSVRMPPEIAALLLEHGLGKNHLDAALAKGAGAATLRNEVLRHGAQGLCGRFAHDS